MATDGHLISLFTHIGCKLQNIIETNLNKKWNKSKLECTRNEQEMPNYKPYGQNFQLSKDSTWETPGFWDNEDVAPRLYPISKVNYDIEKSLKFDTKIKPFKAYKNELKAETRHQNSETRFPSEHHHMSSIYNNDNISMRVSNDANRSRDKYLNRIRNGYDKKDLTGNLLYINYLGI